jgi:hypothetical protein
MDYSDQVFYGFIRGGDGLLQLGPRFDGAPNDLGGGDLLPAGDPRNALPRFLVQSQCQRRCHGVTFDFILPYYAMYYKGWEDRAVGQFDSSTQSTAASGKHLVTAVAVV